jgi:DNA-binding GntR family transcriptional regulator
MEAIKPKKSLVEETYEILVDAICTREILPGERLNQDEIAAKLNVSRQPVNSAIAILKADRLVEDNGRRGVVVSALDPGQFRSIYEYRLTIEPFAVRLAGERLPDGADGEAAEILRRGREAVSSGDILRLLQVDKDFHEMIYRWSGNQIVEASMRVTWTHIRRAMAEVLREPSRTGATWDEHERILAGLLDGDVDKAEAAMRDHISTAYDRYFAPGAHGAQDKAPG